jgi:hypothetical protein
MDMTPFLSGLLPALGGIGVWFAWKFAKGTIEERDEARRRRRIDAKADHEIERLR